MGVWIYYEASDGWTLVRELDRAAAERAVRDGYEKRWSVEARGWNSAHQAAYTRLGYGTYKPMLDQDGAPYPEDEEDVEFDEVAARWDRAVWDEGDANGQPLEFLFEFNAVGEVVRQVEVAGPDREPVAASSAVEWWSTQNWTRQATTSASQNYERSYGRPAEGCVSNWGPEYPGVSISKDEFEDAWERARRKLDQAQSED